MRIKISFLKDQHSGNTLPLHHQKLLNDSLTDILNYLKGDPALFNFSSLKGTSKIQKGLMKFLSSKITLAISSKDINLVEQVTKTIFSQERFFVGRMQLIPKEYQVIPDPEFSTRMRYLCISPMVLFDPSKDPDKCEEILDPTSHQFSDILYNLVLDKMEQCGFPEHKLRDFEEFDASPDKEYVEKVNSNGKKFARYYKNSQGKSMCGYLLPFTLHAHPMVHEFVWQSGIGALNHEGYGMVDLVK